MENYYWRNIPQENGETIEEHKSRLCTINNNNESNALVLFPGQRNSDNPFSGLLVVFDNEDLKKEFLITRSQIENLVTNLNLKQSTWKEIYCFVGPKDTDIVRIM